MPHAFPIETYILDGVFKGRRFVQSKIQKIVKISIPGFNTFCFSFLADATKK